jgi:lysozyme
VNSKGIDVSYWQGLNIDWKKVRGNGISFVLLRATSGLKKDSSYPINYSGSGDAGILRGSYHYFYPQYDVLQQARLFTNTILNGELPPILDVEQDGLTETNVRAFLKEFERVTGRKPIIYTSAYKWNTLIGTNTLWASVYDLWVAHYTTRPDPYLPKAWIIWKFWQFTNKGHVDGYYGDIDMNYFNGDENALYAYAGGITPPSPPPSIEQRLADLEKRVKKLEEVVHP